MAKTMTALNFIKHLLPSAPMQERQDVIGFKILSLQT
jgi:hypothetical protein